MCLLFKYDILEYVRVVEAESKAMGSISMNFAEGLEMLSLEQILDSSLLRRSRATFENAFYMCYLFIYLLYCSFPDVSFLQSLLEKQTNNKIIFCVLNKKK